MSFLILFINKFRLSKQLIYFYIIIMIILTINLLGSLNKNYVFVDGASFIIYSFIPIYLITQNLVSFHLFKSIWLKMAVIFTLLLPVFYLFRKNGIISYYDIGFLAHINLLILTYYIFDRDSRYKMKRIVVYALANLFILTVFGSRMVLITTLLTIVITFFLVSDKKNIRFYINISGVFILSLLFTKNIENILAKLNVTLADYGIRSRNLSLFLSQLNEKNDSTLYLSGRDDIYPIVIEYLRANLFFPSGLGITRTITNNNYYHSHNFFLEILLIFGLFGSLVLISVYFYKFGYLYKYKDYLENRTKLYLLTILSVSFLFRSLTGTYFITDVIFLFCLGTIMSINSRGNMIKREHI